MRMVGNCPREKRIIRTKLGQYIGDKYWQTEDGIWWEKWDGNDRTGQEVRTKIGNIIK